MSVFSSANTMTEILEVAFSRYAELCIWMNGSTGVLFYSFLALSSVLVFFDGRLGLTHTAPALDLGEVLHSRGFAQHSKCMECIFQMCRRGNGAIIIEQNRLFVTFFQTVFVGIVRSRWKMAATRLALYHPMRLIHVTSDVQIQQVEWTISS